MKKYIITLIIFVSLTISVFSLYKLIYKMYDKYNDTRLDPLSKELLLKDFSKNYDYVFLGDSHAQYWKLNKENVLNLGMTGQTSEQIQIRSTLIKDTLKGENLILSIGANDVKAIATNPENIDKIVFNFQENLNKIIANHKKHFNDIYIITIPPDFNPGFQQLLFNYQVTRDAKIMMNNKIRLIAKEKRLRLIDANNLLENNRLGISLKEFSEDGVHMNKNAYMILEKYIK